MGARVESVRCRGRMRGLGKLSQRGQGSPEAVCHMQARASPSEGEGSVAPTGAQGASGPQQRSKMWTCGRGFRPRRSKPVQLGNWFDECPGQSRPPEMTKEQCVREG